MNHTARLKITVAFGVFASVTAPPAFAEDVFLGSVDVGESLRAVQTDTATAETILDQEELDARQASTLARLIDTVPGATLSNAATPQGSSINIRGLGSVAGVYGANTKVSVVVDGVAKGQEEIYRQGSTLTMEPELFKQVSVIRGPGESFRFSSGAIGGTVEAVTKDAADFLEGSDTFAFRQKLSFQSNGEGAMSTSILAWKPDDRLDVIGFLGYRTAEDYEDGDGISLEDTGYDLGSSMVKIKYHARDDLSFTASYSQSQNRLEDVSYDLIGSSFSARIDADVEDTTAYLALDYNPADNDLINTTVKFIYSDELIENVSATTRSTIYNADNRTVRRALTAENEALFSTGPAHHTLLTGFETGERERTSVSHTGKNAGATPGGTDEYFAAYITDKMEWDALTLTPQLRYEHQTITSNNNARVPDGTEYTESDWAGAISARYAVSPAVAVFGTLAYNTNLPIIDDLTSSTKIVTTEKAVTQELGISFDGKDVLSGSDALSAKLTGFQTRLWDNTTYTNYTSYTDPTADTFHIDLSGFEFEFSYSHPLFYADFNASSLRAEWGDGSYFNNAPADSAQLTLGKRFMDEQFDVAIEMRHDWSTERNYPYGGTPEESPSFTVSNLTAAYKPNSGMLNGVEARAAVENVFDKAYTPYLSSKPAPGRTFRLSLAKTF